MGGKETKDVVLSMKHEENKKFKKERLNNILNTNQNDRNHRDRKLGNRYFMGALAFLFVSSNKIFLDAPYSHIFHSDCFNSYQDSRQF